MRRHDDFAVVASSLVVACVAASVSPLELAAAVTADDCSVCGVLVMMMLIMVAACLIMPACMTAWYPTLIVVGLMQDVHVGVEQRRGVRL